MEGSLSMLHWLPSLRVEQPSRQSQTTFDSLSAKHSHGIMSCYFGFGSNGHFAREKLVLAGVCSPLARPYNAEVQFLRLPPARAVVPG